MGRAGESLLELRAADALTRLLRDQLMRSAVILERAQAERAPVEGRTTQAILQLNACVAEGASMVITW